MDGRGCRGERCGRRVLLFHGVQRRDLLVGRELGVVVRPCWLDFDRCLELGLLVMEQRNRLGRGQELVVDQIGLLAPLCDLR